MINTKWITVVLVRLIRSTWQQLPIHIMQRIPTTINYEKYHRCTIWCWYIWPLNSAIFYQEMKAWRYTNWFCYGEKRLCMNWSLWCPTLLLFSGGSKWPSVCSDPSRPLKKASHSAAIWWSGLKRLHGSRFHHGANTSSHLLARLFVSPPLSQGALCSILILSSCHCALSIRCTLGTDWFVIPWQPMKIVRLTKPDDYISISSSSS